jgi:hypothetical protein
MYPKAGFGWLEGNRATGPDLSDGRFGLWME